jgi:hypothetical protein
MIVLDYTARISPAALKAAGVSGVCRYLSWAKADWKVIHKPEYDELVNAGIDVFLNWEFDSHDWMGGASVGMLHGNEAVRQAKALGYTPGDVIYGSCDFDITLDNWNTAAAAYAVAFKTAVERGGYTPGAYGPYDVLSWLDAANIMHWFWQAAMSTSWSHGRNAKTYPGAVLAQRGYKTVGGVQADWNEILHGGVATMTEQYPEGSIPQYPTTSGAEALSILLTRTNYLANNLHIAQSLTDLAAAVEVIHVGQAEILVAAKNDGDVTVTADPAATAKLAQIEQQLADLRAAIASAQAKSAEILAGNAV